MIRSLSALLACVSAAAILTPGVSAQQPNLAPSHQLLITGCLRRNAEGAAYSITDAQGRSWRLVGEADSDVHLQDHVFHVVTVTGKEAQNNTHDAPTNQLPTLRVLSLKMVSNSCTR